MTTIIDRGQYPAQYRTKDFGPFNAADVTVSTTEVSSASQDYVVLEWCPDHNSWIDAIWMRTEGTITEAGGTMRVFRINDGQTPAAALNAGQWITENLAYNAIVRSTGKLFTMLSTRGGRENKIKPFGRIGIRFDAIPTGMLDAVFTIRYREAQP